ncbi:MAG: hypothetical protein K0B14_18180 [Anaerolineaceae bacterium]|nr:hypothetical protein [Anaerolineaceae bacterium]
MLSFPKLGFYWDDWQAVFLYQNNNNQLIREFFLFDRPFSSWTYEFLFPFLPMNPMVWQIFTMVTRVLAVWLIVSTFEKIWADRQLLFRWTGAVLIVFPSFTLQPISVAFSQHFITFFIFALSIYLMVLSVTSQARIRWVFFVISIILTGLHIFTMEYFLGLEVIRPFLIYFAIKSKNVGILTKKLLQKIILFYLPFALIIMGFIYWRLYIFPDQLVNQYLGEEPNAPVIINLLIQNPLKGFLKLANLILQDVSYLLTQSWLRAIEPTSIRLDAAFFGFSIFVGFIISSLFFVILSVNDRRNFVTENHSRLRGIVIISSLALLFGGLTVWITNRQLIQGKWSDRFSLAPMIGTVLLILIIIEWFVRSGRPKNIILVCFLGFAIAFQMRTTHSYALDWQNQLDFFWQLHWRIPAVKPGTAFFSAILPSNYSSDYSVGFALNTLFRDEIEDKELEHWYFDPGGKGYYFNELETENDILYSFRNLSFSGSTSNAITYMFKPGSGCLLLLDKAYEGNSNMDLNHQELIKLNNLDQIDLDSPSKIPDRHIFGDEPVRDWCYYFQKADISRKSKDWIKTLEVVQEGYNQGFHPRSGVERIPEMEAYFYLNDWDSFLNVSNEIYQMDFYLDRYLCTQWDRLEMESQSIIPKEVKSKLISIVDCSQPFKQ